MFVRIKPFEELKDTTSYDQKVENYVKTKEHRIIEVEPIQMMDNNTFFKCPELDYIFIFNKAMFYDASFEIDSLLTIKKTIQELLNDSKNETYQDSYYEDGVKDGYETALEEVLNLFKNI